MPGRVVLAMSGGVDSSVAAYLLKQQGYEVIGLFMRTGAHGSPETSTERTRGCCSALDAGDARRVADQLDIPFYALDFEKDFERIIDYFADEYLKGRTPNPCVVCNNWLKFGKLWSYGQQLEADFIATGHYARILWREGVPELHRAVDASKDQSYVLHGIRPSILPRLLFPIGAMEKPAIRALAREAGLRVADKPDSVEICFVPDGDHAGLIQRRRPEASSPGHFVDRAGRELGDHDGIERFTVGQRKGLGIGFGERRYVLEIVPASNEVVLGPKEDLLADGLWGTKINWLSDVPEGAEFTCLAKIRYRHEPTPARVRVMPDSCVRVEFEQAQSAVTPGQAVVFYDGERVLGGGWIESAIHTDALTQAGLDRG
jgi:tRNA-uridine 2-sulfurtransferase